MFIRFYTGAIVTDKNKLVIGMVADYVLREPHYSHMVGHKYVRAVVDGMNATPVLWPALGDDSPLDQWLSMVDGVMLTGSYSNVEPRHYHGTPSDPDTAHDPVRDATTLPLIKAALTHNVPLLGLCRGYQEINVALGGTLHQKVHEQKPFMDHREDKDLPLEGQYAPVHNVTLTPDGYLYNALQKPSIMVNSLHQQGVDKLADSLQVEGVADDGLIESFSLRDPANFLLGVQWHPEWQVTKNPDSMKLFSCFADACLRQKTAR